MKKQSAFTLIELMIVMAIIAILVTAGLSAYTGYLKKARDSERIAIARELQTAVEAFSVNGTPPTLAELTAYLAAEGIGWNIGTSQTHILGWLDTAVYSLHTLGIGNTFALIEDPIGGKAVCLDHLGNATIVCQFGYYTFSDGTYAISYGVETEGALVNPHYSALTTPRTYGSFVGNNSAITVPMTDTTNIEDESVLTGIGITATGGTLSDVDGNTNGGTDGGGGVECAAPGETCLDGSVYVNSSLRTTASDAGFFPWIDCSFCNGDGEGFMACYGQSGWACPADADIPLAGHPAAQACANLGEGWRLPSRSELDQLFQVSNCKSANGNCDDTGAVVGGFSATSYSTSEEDYIEYFWKQWFGNGQQGSMDNKWYGGDVRCVRSI